MATTTLVLKDANAKGVTRVLCLLVDGRDVRIKISTGVSILPKHWSTKKKYVLSANSNSVDINNQLKAFKNRVLNIYLEAKNTGKQPDKQYLLDELRPKEVAKSKNKSFFDVWELYLKSNKSNYKPKSFEKFASLKNHLLNFEKKKSVRFDLHTLNQETLEKLQNYFYEDLNLRTSTASRYLDLLKTFLNWAYNQEYTSNKKHKSFKPIKAPDTLKVIFTPEEISMIESFEPESDYLVNAKELLILSIYTGLRHSDYSIIKAENININMDGSYTLTMRQQKTKEYVDIPLNKRALEIVNKFIEGKVRGISNQKLNKYIKELCKKAEVEQLVEVHDDRGKLSAVSYKPKYEVVTTHTGRRTFCTNLLLKGIPAEIVMKFSGHKDYKSFAKYVNVPKNIETDLVRKALE